MWKLPSACADEQFLAWKFFQKFSSALDFLQKPLAWFSNFHLPVQSKNSGRNSCFILLFRFFSDFQRKNFQTFGQKTSRNCQIYPLREQTNNFWLEIFFKSFEPFWICCRNLWPGSQTSIFVSREKIPEEVIFLFFFSDFFRILSETFFQIFGQKTSRNCQTNFCVCRRTIFGLKFFFKIFEPFWIFCRNLWRGAQTSIFVSRVKIPEEINFLILLFIIFSDFERIFFRLLAKKLQEVFKTTFYVTCPKEHVVAWVFFKKIWIVLDFLQKPSAWFSKFYLGVQSKNCGRLSFFILLFRIFSEFERKIFRFLAEKLQEVAKLTSVCADEQFLAWNFFQNFWTVLDFLQKHLAWCSNFYLRVQSKNSGRNNFF